jgi:pimeloyl-ACP methyl ester carboxylesterase
MKYLLRLLLVMVVTGVVFAIAGVIATWAPDRNVDQLKERWAQPPSHFVLIRGMQVHVRDEGPRDDPAPIVLLHGTSSSLHTWDGWTDALKAKRRVIRFDLPGFGLTGPERNNDYSLEAYVACVAGVVDALGVNKFVLAGNSLGGQIAWATASALPARVQQLVLVDAAGYPLEPRSVPIGFRIARAPALRWLAEIVLPRGVIESSLRNVYADPGKVTSALVDRYYELTLREGNRAALGYRMDQMQKTDVVASVAKIQSLKVPTLVLWGNQDYLIPVENGRRFAADISGAQLLVLDKLGHVPQEEDPVRSLQAVLPFLQKP